MPSETEMDHAGLARRLAEADETERAPLLEQHASLADAALGYALKTFYLDSYLSDPAQAIGASKALTLLAQQTNNQEIVALAAWIGGMAALQLEGLPEQAVPQIEEAATLFDAVGKSEMSALTRVSKVHALAILGRYDEAIEAGLEAHELLLAEGDALTAGKVEQNLGNLYHRREQYHDSERFYRLARTHFSELGDRGLIAAANNGLANILTVQHQFQAAMALFEEGLTLSTQAGTEVIQAIIECNLGVLALSQGRYDRALDLLEKSRRHYALLEMPHDSAIAEQELADAYLELNLAPEAAATYTRVVPLFAELGMRAEQARALAYHGRALLALEQLDEAETKLAAARELYRAEGNEVGAAIVTFTEAQVHYARGDYAAAATAAAAAEGPFAEAGAVGRRLAAQWLRGEATRLLGQIAEAEALLQSVLREAEAQGVPPIVQRCYTSLGQVAATLGDGELAKSRFKQAVGILEAMRAPLPAEEFRTAFVTDKLTPYTELVRLYLAEGGPQGVVEALDYVERARSRALADMMAGALQVRPATEDPFEADLLARLDSLREELNWFYSQINRPPDSDSSRGPTMMAHLQEEVRAREESVQEITRQLQQRNPAIAEQAEPPELAPLQRLLGETTALVEYWSLDGDLLAFLVTGDSVEVVRDLGREEEAEAALTQFRFQMDAMRYGAERLRPHLGQLLERAQHYLGTLYDLLLRPIEARLGTRRLVVVPHRSLHYVPFHALYDGTSYVIERRELSYAPSATILRRCLDKPRRALHRALLLGVPDEQTPRVRDEVQALAPLFPETLALLDDEATVGALRDHAPTADLLHLACHGLFRPDNPLFSALHLADGWLTVRDVYSLDLHCELVTLSACETGVSAVAPGDELLGLARGFFSVGTPSLLVSLWTVDDAATASLMSTFYARLRAGERPAAALRHAQRTLLAEQPHPFFWSPFILLGRW